MPVATISVAADGLAPVYDQSAKPLRAALQPDISSRELFVLIRELVRPYMKGLVIVLIAIACLQDEIAATVTALLSLVGFAWTVWTSAPGRNEMARALIR